MSDRKRGVPTDSDDLGKAPFLDEAERTEFEWLLARDSDPDAPAPSSAIARNYAELEELLATLPSQVSDDRWQQEVMQAASKSTPALAAWSYRRMVRWTSGVAVAVAAAAALALWPCGTASPRELEVAIVHADQRRSDVDPKRGDGSAVLGDHLVVTARTSGLTDLRVYRSDGKLVARCPDGPGCRTPLQGEYTIDVELDAPVEYRVILAVGMSDATVTEKDAYLEAARVAKARVVTYPPISVR
jgi:hypothetical protein